MTVPFKMPAIHAHWSHRNLQVFLKLATVPKLPTIRRDSEVIQCFTVQNPLPSTPENKVDNDYEGIAEMIRIQRIRRKY